jgi:hypothetical protein
MKEHDVAMFENMDTIINYFDRLQLLATSLFEWEGLDDVAGKGASRFLEQTLYQEGKACFVKDDKLGYLVLKANPNGKLNVYDLPTSINAYSFDYDKNYTLDNCVLIFNNDLMLPTRELISSFAYRLYETERTIDVNINAQKTPVVIEGDTKAALTLKNIWMQFTGNMPIIFGNKNFDLNGKLNAIDTKAPYLVDKLDLHKQRLWNEVMTILGINNANTDKKERLIVDEVNSNNQLIGYYLNTWLKSREVAKNEINKKYFNGEEKVKVKVNDIVTNLTTETNINFDKEQENE